jgi:hypothetical protein
MWLPVEGETFTDGGADILLKLEGISAVAP